MTTVLYCHSKVYEDSQSTIRHWASDAIWVDTSGSDFAYSQALRQYWGEAGDLIVIEHDIKITKRTLPSFAECPQPWCSFCFDVKGQLIDFALGCTKWSEEARRLISPPKRENWRTLDVRLRELFIWQGLEPHNHGMVEHLHPYTPDMNRFDENLVTWIDRGDAQIVASSGHRGPPLPESPFTA